MPQLAECETVKGLGRRSKFLALEEMQYCLWPAGPKESSRGPEEELLGETRRGGCKDFLEGPGHTVRLQLAKPLTNGCL